MEKTEELKGDFGIYNINNLMEDNIKLDGNYGIRTVNDQRNYQDLDGNINCQAVFRIANVFCRLDTENLKELILLFSEYSCRDIDGIEKCTSKPVQLVGGTICPTRKRLFRFKSKEFVAFGRYIFGYDAKHVRIIRDGTMKESTHKRKNKISNDEIILRVPSYVGEWRDEYVYSFMIFDYETGILDAFGLYR